MNFKKLLWFTVFLVFSASLVGWRLFMHPPLIKKPLNIQGTNAEMVEPLWRKKALVVVFVDTKTLDVTALTKRLAEMDIATVMVDSRSYLQAFSMESHQCLSDENIQSFLTSLLQVTKPSSDQPIILAGLADGALIPFINAMSVSLSKVTNLSIGFSAKVAGDLNVCPPLSSKAKGDWNLLTPPSEHDDNWRVVWTDQPDDETGVFIRNLGTVNTRIAPYNTPLSEVLIQELSSIVGIAQQAEAPMPVVEVPVAKPGNNSQITLFYSGDGGWRDLDRTVASEMAAQNFPVVGVDVLRYFWEHKSPEQAAMDLSATMAFYRQHWGVKSFVLAGYSFGADILPPMYNRLPPSDQADISLLVLLALADYADFEIHVSGWLGEKGGELALAPELAKLPSEKILCVYGVEEKSESACTSLARSKAMILELPGGHHFDQDYPKLTNKILDVYRTHNIQ